MKLKPLLPHQETAWQYAKDKTRLALFMEMRLGKSLVAVKWALSKNPTTVLIVTVNSAIQDWLQLLEECGIPVTWLSGPVPKRLSQIKSGWYITNYSTFSSLQCGYLPPLDVMICDESTRIRNPKARTTKRLTSLSKLVPYKALLTGLPNPESSLDYFCQMCWLYGTWMGYDNYYMFRNRYYEQVRYDWVPKRDTLGEINEALKYQCFRMMRSEVKVGSQIEYRTRYLDRSPAQKKAIEEIKVKWALGETRTQWRVVVQTWLAYVAGGFHPRTKELLASDKYSEILYLLETELKGQQLVIWFNMNHELENMVNRLRAERISCGSITGKTSISERSKLVAQFRNGKIRVLCLQLKCASYGLDLSCCDTAVYYSNTYEYEIRKQTENRLIHPLKTRTVLVVDLVFRETLDQAVVEAYRDKSITSKLFQARVLDKLKGFVLQNRPRKKLRSKNAINRY